MTGHETTLAQVREELEAQNRAFADALTAMGVTTEDLRRCDLELSEAIVDGFWSEVCDIPSVPQLRPTSNVIAVTLRG